MHIHKKKSYAYIKSQNNFKNSALISSFIAQKVLIKKYKQKIT